MKIITSSVLARWILTIFLLGLSVHFANNGFPEFIIVMAVVASIFCELYWYLWQKERGHK